MNYKEKYEQALERAKGLLEDMDKKEFFASSGDIENIFPELQEQESEDERIRKRIIHALHGDVLDMEETTKAIAWLEKQDENKPTENIEIKFCEGDSVVSNQDGKVYIVGTAYYVTGDGEDICLHDTDGNHLWTNRDDLNKNYHLWTITDAKDGDVLNSPSHRLIWIYKDNEHYHVCVNMNYVTKNIATDGLIKIPSDAYPATKDERTILFEKTKEAGYEWDSEKKELKKIEPKTLDANKVIAWLVAHILDYEYLVECFKRDFGLC